VGGDYIGSGSSQMALRRRPSALLDHASGCPEHRPSSAKSVAWAALAGHIGLTYCRHRWEGEGLTEEQRGAVEAVARNEPRPGHSVLGVGTFEAAKPAF
jgi:hypothetical protein